MLVCARNGKETTTYQSYSLDEKKLCLFIDDAEVGYIYRI